jgi:hypothetical protein
VVTLPPGALRSRALAGLEVQLTVQWGADEADAAGRRVIAGSQRGRRRRVLRRHRAGAGAHHLGPTRVSPGTAGPHDRWAEPAHTVREQELSTRYAAAGAHLQLDAFHLADEQMTRCVERARRLQFTSADVHIAWWRIYRVAEAVQHTLTSSRVSLWAVGSGLVVGAGAGGPGVALSAHNRACSTPPAYSRPVDGGP